MEDKDFRFIQDQIGYEFRNLDLLQQAFVRRSYAKENGGEDNEVLEFIGDKALDIVAVKILTETYGFYASECDDYNEENDYDEFCCEHSEGKLTELKKRLVGKKMLSSRIDRLGFAEYLIMGRGDERNHIEREESVKEDLFEAIVGAVTLDSGWNFDDIQATVDIMLNPDSYLFEEANYVELIQEWSLKKYKELPQMNIEHSSYYEENSGLIKRNEMRFQPKQYDIDRHTFRVINTAEYFQTHFKCQLVFCGLDIRFIGYGRSKKEARNIVCEGVYHYLEKSGMLFSIRDEIENPNKAEAINQLEILARRGYFSIPTYNFKQGYDKDGNPIWECECHIAEYSTYFSAKSSSKKDAKKSAAFKMLRHVLSEKNAR